MGTEQKMVKDCGSCINNECCGTYSLGFECLDPHCDFSDDPLDPSMASTKGCGDPNYTDLIYKVVNGKKYEYDGIEF